MTIAQRIDRHEAAANAALVSWLVRATALKTETRESVAFTAQAAGAPPAIVEAIKAAAISGQGQPVLTGANAATAAFIETMTDSSALMRLIADRAVHRAPFNSRLMASVGISASAVLEGSPIPVYSPEFTGQTIIPQKVAAMLVATNQIWADVSGAGQAFLSGLLRSAVASAADAMLFENLAPEDPTAEATAGDEASIVAGLKSLLNAVHVKSGARLYWAVSTAAANELGVLDHSKIDPFGGVVLGAPAIITGGLSGNQVALIDGRGVVVEMEEIRFDASDDATLEISEAPTNHSITPTPTQQVSLFQTHSIAARAIMSLGVQQVRAGSVATLEIA